MDAHDFAASLSDGEIPAVLDDLFRRRADVQYAIDLLWDEADRRRAYRKNGGRRNGALRGRAVRRAEAPLTS